jgi:outer membrane protein insertion porin family
MRRLLLVLTLIPAVGFAQAGARSRTAAATAKWPIESLQVEGNQHYSQAQILAAAGLRVGQLAGKSEFDAARDRLVACGAFENVEYRFTAGVGGKGYVGTFRVAEVQQVYPVTFRDLGVSAKDLFAALAARDPLFSNQGVAATPPVIERYSQWIQEYLAGHGIRQPVVGSIEPSESGELTIVFHPDRPLPAVAEVTFEGNRALEQSVLREAIARSAIGLPYTEDNFRQVLRLTIRPLYEAHGFLRVSFPEIRTEPAPDVQGVRVFVTVQEQESYRLGSVSIEGETPLPSESLKKAGEFPVGDTANLERVHQGAERIRKILARAGYLDAQVSSEPKINDATKTVDIALAVNAGPLFTMGKLEIVGLDLEGEAAIQRIWGLKPGKPFNPDYPEEFLKRVRDEGMFDHLGKTASAIKKNPDHTIDVTLTFSGDEPRSRPGRARGRGD